MKIFDIIAWILLVVGGLNWGAVALNYNFVDMIFGTGSLASHIIYGLVGISAIWELIRWKCFSSDCRM